MSSFLFCYSRRFILIYLLVCLSDIENILLQQLHSFIASTILLVEAKCNFIFVAQNRNSSKLKTLIYLNDFNTDERPRVMAVFK